MVGLPSLHSRLARSRLHLATSVSWRGANHATTWIASEGVAQLGKRQVVVVFTQRIRATVRALWHCVSFGHPCCGSSRTGSNIAVSLGFLHSFGGCSGRAPVHILSNRPIVSSLENRQQGG